MAKRDANNNLLVSTDVSSWVKPLRDASKKLLENYLFGCPSRGCSVQSKHIPCLDSADVEGCKLALRVIESYVQLQPVDDAAALGKRLRRDKRAADKLPNGGDEFAYYALSPYIVYRYGLCKDVKKEQLNKGVWNQFRPILELDCFFRHIRNSLAHGLYCKTSRKPPHSSKRETYWFFQDSSTKGNVTCRIFLRDKSLCEIADKLQNR